MKAINLAIVANNASRKMGGEAQKILIYREKFCQKNLNTFLVCHVRTKQEIEEELTRAEFHKVRFVQDSKLQKKICKVSQYFPDRIKKSIFYSVIGILFQINARKVLLDLIREEKIDVVFQPTPNSPLMPSAIFKLGVPVVVGPLTGGMDFPPGFRHMDSSITRLSLRMGKFFASFLHRFLPGKKRANAVLVSNDQTKSLLPQDLTGKVYNNILESGVDLSNFRITKKYIPKALNSYNLPVNYVFVGRLVDWKGVTHLLNAFKEVSDSIDSRLHLVGDGVLKTALETQAESLGIKNKVQFTGWMNHSEIMTFLTRCDVFVMPSLRESGGNAILEAMALGLPVIVTNWGGPGRIVNDSCGIRVNPDSPKEFERGLAEAMVELGRSPRMQYELGMAGRKRCSSEYFDWDTKTDLIIEIFKECILHEQEQSQSSPLSEANLALYSKSETSP